jgi:hypothetical protein
MVASKISRDGMIHLQRAGQSVGLLSISMYRQVLKAKDIGFVLVGHKVPTIAVSSAIISKATGRAYEAFSRLGIDVDELRRR